MKLLVTGCNGNLGRDVSEVLKNYGYNLIGIDLQKESDFEHYYNCDLRNFHHLEEIFLNEKHIDVIIHLAAKIDFSNIDNSLMDINLMGTYNLAFLGNKYNVGKIIYLSSIPISKPPQSILDEFNYIDSPNTVYHLSKFLGEKVIQPPVYKNDYIIFRIASPITTRMKDTFFSKTINNAKLNNDILVSGRGTRVQNYIDSRDIAAAIHKSINTTVSGLFFLSGESISNIDLVRKIVSRLNSRSRVVINHEISTDDDVKWNISREYCKSKLKFESVFLIEDMIDKLIG